MRASAISCVFLILQATGCSGGTANHTGSYALPHIADRPIYDIPIDQAAEDVQNVWGAIQALLSNPLVPPKVELDLEEYNHWSKEVLGPWLQTRFAQLAALQKEIRRLPTEPRNQFFAAVIMATAYAETIEQLRALPLPAEFSGNEKLATVFRSTLNEHLGKLSRPAREAYWQCAELTPGLPSVLQGWGVLCVDRANGLAALADLPAISSGQQSTPSPELPPECEGETGWEDPQAPPPDESAARKVAVVYSWGRLAGKDRERLLSAVADRLRNEIKIPLVPLSAVKKAERLREQRRLKPGGPVCGQAPPLPAILAERFPNLVLAQVSTICSTPIHSLDDPAPTAKAKTCTLEVWFDRAGTNDLTGLPPILLVDLDETPDSPDVWVSAAARLSNEKRAGILGGLQGSSLHSPFLRVLGHEKHNPWLRLAPTLYSMRDEILECHAGQGVSSIEAQWIISPVGIPYSIEVGPRTVAEGSNGDKIAECVARVLERITWPCTRSKKPEVVDLRMCIGR